MTPLPVTVVIPAKPRGALRSWRRLVTLVREGGRDTFATEGQWLDPGVAYEIPAKAIVLACDLFAGQRIVSMSVPGKDAGAGLEVVKSWTLKGPLGKRVTDYVARRLAPDAATHAAAPVEDLPNRHDGICPFCRQPVTRHQGVAVTRGGVKRPAHRKGECPPPPPLPEREEPNMYGGACALCGGWVAPEAGAAVLARSPEPGSKAKYQPVHLKDCPPPPPGPVNARWGWCAQCCEEVGAGEGCWPPAPDTPGAPERVLVHHPECPVERLPDVATWVVKPPGPDRYYAAGDVIRARIDTRNGGPAIPPDAPGHRVLADVTGYVQIYGYVRDVVKSPIRLRVRACTEEEAAPLVAEDVMAVLSATRHGPGFRAAWTAEQIGDKKPWVAELTGWNPSYGYDRDFLRAKADYSGANSRETRGVQFTWTLQLDRVYEAWWMRSWSDHQRAYLRVTPEGDVRRIGREEAEAWLSLPASAR